MAVLEPNPSEASFLALLGRQWRTLSVGFIALAATSTVGLSLLPDSYEASAKLLVMRSEQSTGGLKVVDNLVPELSIMSNPLYTQVELLRVEPVFLEVIASLGMTSPSGKPLSPEAFAQRLRVRPIDKTDLIQISYSDADPERARRVIEALCQAYLTASERYRRDGVEGGLKLVDQQLESARKALADAEQALLGFKKRTGTVALPEEIHASVQALGELQSEMRGRQTELARARARAAVAREQLGMDAREGLRAASITQNPTVRSLQEQLVAAESAPLLSQGLGPQHPDVVAHRQRIAMLRQALNREVRSLTGGNSASGLDSVRLGLLRELASAEADIRGSQAALSVADSRRQHLVRQMAVLPEQEIELSRLTREVRVAGEIYQQLLQKREEARLHLAIAPTFVRVIQPPVRPDKPVSPLPGPALPIALVGSLIGALGLGAIKDLLERRGHPQAVVAALPDLKVFAALPHLSRHERRQGELLLRQPDSPHYSEAIKALAMAIEGQASGTNSQVLALTSPQAREGKSVTIANLAVALADAGKRVLLVDMDLRRPRLHAIFGLGPGNPGLTEVLLGRLPSAAVIRRTDGPDLITAGATALPGSLIKARRVLTRLYEDWKQSYDFVLIDLPPLVVLSEVAHVGRMTDGVLMLSNMESANAEAVVGGIHQLQAFGVPVTGVVAISKVLGSQKGGYYLIAGEGLVQ